MAFCFDSDSKGPGRREWLECQKEKVVGGVDSVSMGK